MISMIYSKVEEEESFAKQRLICCRTNEDFIGTSDSLYDREQLTSLLKTTSLVKQTAIHYQGWEFERVGEADQLFLQFAKNARGL